MVHPGHLGRLAAQQRAVVEPARLGHAADDVGHLLGHDLRAGDVVEEEQRARVLHEHVVHAVVDEVDPDAPQPTGACREGDLRADPVRRRHQHGVVHLLQRRHVEGAPECADPREHRWALRAGHGPGQEVDRPCALVDVDPARRVAAGGAGDGAPPDVTAHLRAVERDARRKVICALTGCVDVGSDAGRRGDPPAARHEGAMTAGLDPRPEDDAGAVAGADVALRPGEDDRAAGHRCRRVALGGEHDGAGGRVLPADALGAETVERSRRAGHRHLDEVARHERQQDLGLRIAEAAVELEDPRPVGCEHQPGVEHAAVGAPLECAAAHHRHEDRAGELLHERRRTDRGGCVRAHAARVRTTVTLADALVVLCRRHDGDALPVAEGEQRDLLADEQLLQHDGAPAAQGGPDGVEGLLDGCGHDHALSRREAVRLHDHGHATVTDPGERGVELGRGEAPRARRGDAVALAEGGGVRLRPFELSRGAGRTEGDDAGGGERVDHAGLDGRVGAHEHEVDLLPAGELGDGLRIVDAHLRTTSGHPGIARRDHEVGAARRARRRPRHRVLTPTRAQHHHPHRSASGSAIDAAHAAPAGSAIIAAPARRTPCRGGPSATPGRAAGTRR